VKRKLSFCEALSATTLAPPVRAGENLATY
jgi:hypothetical protein